MNDSLKVAKEFRIANGADAVEKSLAANIGLTAALVAAYADIDAAMVKNVAANEAYYEADDEAEAAWVADDALAIARCSGFKDYSSDPIVNAAFAADAYREYRNNRNKAAASKKK